MSRWLRWGMAAMSVPAMALFSAVGCSDDQSTGGGGSGGSGDPGAIIGVTMKSKVGVLLDDLPASMRDRVANALIAKDATFWTDRAKTQIALTGYRLVFRADFYDPATDGSKDALPIPLPSGWKVTLGGAPTRTMIDGHDLVVVDYTLDTTILTDPASVAVSEPALAAPGGKWSEGFTFPIDPELVFQRTGFACLDEAEFPPNSVDSEEVDSFYDQTCDIETELSGQGCHQTALPVESCLDALQAHIGHVETTLDYERKPWDASVADQVRAADKTSTDGADLKVFAEEFHDYRVTYRYIDPSSCTLVEQCVGAPGWRRLLQFATADSNTGSVPLDIGQVDYFNDMGGSEAAQHGEYEFSACHQHYHFTHYGSFTYGDGMGTASTAKRGFCLQSTKRTNNDETSPINNPYYDCGYQGIEVGWADEYKAGLECQWIDVTGVDTSAAPVTRSLQFHSNPDGFLCEGKPQLDANGNTVWLPTSFTTTDGKPVDKPGCDYSPGWDQNNVDQYDVTLPVNGEGYVTDPCKRGQLGALRNCGFTKADDKLTCTPGAMVSLSCSIPPGAAPQTLRVCETSAVLKTGIPCTFDQALTNEAVDETGANVSFVCPAARDANEPGGGYALYTGSLYPDDAAAQITCTAM